MSDTVFWIVVAILVLVGIGVLWVARVVASLGEIDWDLKQ